MAKTFKFGENGKWATKTGSSMAYNDQNGNFKPIPFSVTRDSIATRVNKQGLIEVVGKDKLRIDYKDSSNGVALLEPARTNLLTYSEDLSVSYWTKSNVTTTANAAISPDGTQNASEIVGTTSSNFTRAINVAVGNGDTTMSCYVKSNDGVERDFVFGAGSLGASNNGTFTATSEWQRIEFTINTTAQSTDFGFFNSNGNQLNMYVWGVQLEAGSYATSYIPTSGSTVQRAADVANGAGNAQVFNDSEGVLFANMFIEDNIEDNVNISVSGGVHENDTFKFIYLPSTNELRAELNISPTVNTRITYDNLSLGQYNKIAASFNASTLKLYVNGFETNSISTNGLPSGLNQMNFDRADGVAPFYGKTKEIGVYDAVLTDAELEALTSYTSFTNMANELNLTIK